MNQIINTTDWFDNNLQIVLPTLEQRKRIYESLRTDTYICTQLRDMYNHLHINDGRIGWHYMTIAFPEWGECFDAYKYQPTDPHKRFEDMSVSERIQWRVECVDHCIKSIDEAINNAKLINELRHELYYPSAQERLMVYEYVQKELLSSNVDFGLCLYIKNVGSKLLKQLKYRFIWYKHMQELFPEFGECIDVTGVEIPLINATLFKDNRFEWRKSVIEYCILKCKIQILTNQ